MKIIKQLSNKIKSVASEVSTFINTQLSFWNAGQIVTAQSMNVFSQDIYEKLALLTTNINKFPVIVFADGGISKFSLSNNKQYINIPALACAFQLVNGQGDNLPYKPYTIAYANAQTIEISADAYDLIYLYASVNINNIDTNPTNISTTIKYTVKLSTPFIDDQYYCLICIIRKNESGVGTSLDFLQTNFLINSAVSTLKSANIIDSNNNFNTITPSALNKGLPFFTNQGNVAQYDSEIIYRQYAQIWTVENTKVIHWISEIDNNQSPKPTLASHNNWRFIQSFSFIADPYIQVIFEWLKSKYANFDKLYIDTTIESPEFIDTTRAEKLGKRTERYRINDNHWQQSFYRGGKNYVINGLAPLPATSVVLFAPIVLPSNNLYPVNLTPYADSNATKWNYQFNDNKTLRIFAYEDNGAPATGTMSYSLEVEIL